MDTQNTELLNLLKAFEKYNVHYLIIGGFAVNRYGYKRATGDVDFYLKDTPANRTSLIDALADIGYGRLEMLMNVPIMAGYCEIMMDNGMYADLMTDIPGLKKEAFDQYFNMATVDIINGISVRFINYNHLIENKQKPGRSKDLLDIEELKKINSRTTGGLPPETHSLP